MSFYAHPTAVIDEGCSIGSGARVWHFSHLMAGSIIGQNCVIGQNVFIATGVELGQNVHVQNNVSLYEGVRCEDDVFLGPSMVFTNIKNPRSAVSRKGQYQQTIIRKGATIGANATIICGIEIGSYALIGAGSVVTRSVPPHALVTGNPARQAGWVSRYGHKLHFTEEGRASCPETGEAYQLQFNTVNPVVS